MSLAKVSVAVVEDNGMARANIRNHLLDMGFSQISCFSNGRDLRANMRSLRIDLLLMDFHLGQNKNGVEVVQDLQKQKKITHTTCVMFITSDRVPMVIGQIFDMHPEALLTKPYTIRNLAKNIYSSLNLHKYLMPIYRMIRVILEKSSIKWQKAMILSVAGALTAKNHLSHADCLL